MKVKLTPTSEADLEEIGDLIASRNPARAVTFLQDLRRCCLSLGRFPEALPIVERYAQHAVRRRVHGPYLILYRVADGAVMILHVRHAARDYDDAVFNM